MMQKIYLVFILMLVVQSITLFESEFDVFRAQSDFDSLFCGQCKRYGQECQGNRQYFRKLPSPWNFDTNSIANNSFHIVKIPIYLSTSTTNYTFPIRRLINKSMNSVIFLPKVQSLQGVLLYYHPTVVGKYNGPSSLGRQITALGGLYGSRGYATIFPNYIGFENDSQPHPYSVYPQQNVRSAVNALNQLVNDKVFDRYQNGVLKLFSNGFSEGSSYAIWTAKCLSTPQKCPYYSNSAQYKMTLNSKYKFIKASGLDGAYDNLKIMLPFLSTDVGTLVQQNRFNIQQQSVTNSGKPVLTTLILKSFFYYTAGLSIKSYVNNDFYNMICSFNIDQEDCQVGGVNYTLDTVLEARNSQINISKAIVFSALGKYLSSYQNKLYVGRLITDLVISQRNSIKSFVDSSLFTQGVFLKTLQSASIVDFASIIPYPTFIFSLMKDSLVPVNNSEYFIQKAQKAGNLNVTSLLFDNKNHIVCDGQFKVPVDHLRGEIIANIYSLNFINQQI